jgi:hypothetical protein
MHPKPMHPAGSHVTSGGSLYIAMMYIVKIVSVKLKESQRALYSTWRTEDIFLEKK